MTTNHHTPLSGTDEVSATVFNSVFSDLDSAISDNEAAIGGGGGGGGGTASGVEVYSAHNTSSSSGRVAFAGENWDTDNYWGIGTPTVITIPYDGYYLISGEITIYNDTGSTASVTITYSTDDSDEGIIARFWNAPANNYESHGVSTVTVLLSEGDELYIDYVGAPTSSSEIAATLQVTLHMQT